MADRLCNTQCIGAVPPFVLNWGGGVAGLLGRRLHWGYWVLENKKASRVRRGLHI
jgi:hypothetical protein